MSRGRWRLSEAELHERVAKTERHDAWRRGIRGYFYRMYLREALKHVEGHAPLEVLEVGCGDGVSFDGAESPPVQIDVSPTRLQRVRARGGRLVCADAYDLPFGQASFELVLLVAVLEHTREPWRILREAHRVLRRGGRVIIVVPNDVSLSLGRLLLLRFPVRYPDHLTFFTPTRLGRWLGSGFEVVEAKFLPFRRLGFFLNLYHFVVARKVAGETS